MYLEKILELKEQVIQQQKMEDIQLQQQIKEHQEQQMAKLMGRSVDLTHLISKNLSQTQKMGSSMPNQKPPKPQKKCLNQKNFEEFFDSEIQESSVKKNVHNSEVSVESHRNCPKISILDLGTPAQDVFEREQQSCVQGAMELNSHIIKNSPQQSHLIQVKQRNRLLVQGLQDYSNVQPQPQQSLSSSSSTKYKKKKPACLDSR